MAHISWSKNVISPASHQTVWADGVTLSLTVVEDRVRAVLTLDSYQSMSPSRGAYARLWCGNESVMMNFEPDSMSYEFTVTSESGTVTATIFPAASWSLAPGEDNPSISESYSGARMNSAPRVSVSIPEAISAGSTIRVDCTMSDADSDALTGTLFRFYKAPGSNNFTQSIISQSLNQSTIYNDTIPASWGGGKIYYALNVSDGKVTSSAATYVRDIAVNNPPSTPSFLNIPATISVNSNIEVEWGESTDPDGNLAGYILERSTNGGANWEEVYIGTECDTVVNIPVGTQTVRFRVRAYDTYNARSDPQYAPASGDISVSSNRAPTTPATITVSPLHPVIGQAIIINWGASSDPDGDDFDYVLERSVDSETNFDAVYIGKNRNWTDTCGSWSTVTYRVKAVDIYGAPSNYAELTEPRTVISNAAPTITCVHSDGADLGIKTGVFSITYSVDDENPSDVLTVKESIKLSTDSEFTVKRTIYNAERGQEYTFNFRTGSSPATAYWNKLPNNDQNEEYNIKISVSDGTTEVSRTFRFTKSTGAFLITLREPIVSVGNIEKAMVSICGNMPSTALKHVQVTANGGSSWVECILASGAVESGIGNRKKTNSDMMNEELLGGHYLFIAAIPVADMGKSFNFKVQAEKVSNVGGYISSIQGTFIEASAT